MENELTELQRMLKQTKESERLLIQIAYMDGIKAATNFMQKGVTIPSPIEYGKQKYPELYEPES